MCAEQFAKNADLQTLTPITIELEVAQMIEAPELWRALVARMI
jgi:hypothetical protein